MKRGGGIPIVFCIFKLDYAFWLTIRLLVCCFDILSWQPDWRNTTQAVIIEKIQFIHSCSSEEMFLVTFSDWADIAHVYNQIIFRHSLFIVTLKDKFFSLQKPRRRSFFKAIQTIWGSNLAGICYFCLYQYQFIPVIQL